MILSSEQARNCIINAQWLNQAKKKSVAEVVRHLGYVQIDTLSVAERAHHHVLFSRNSDYDKSELNELLINKKIFEYWSHAASYLPIQDFRYSLFRKKQYRDGKKHWFEKDERVIRHVLQRLEKEGSLQSKDFNNEKNSEGEWYDWKPAKIALEQLFMEGILMVTQRQGFQKVYDLAERVLPSQVDMQVPTNEEFVSHLIDRSIRSHGIVALNEIDYLLKGHNAILKRVISDKLARKEIQKVTIKGLNNEYYTSIDGNAIDEPKGLHILSPFDNLVIQRKRLMEIFEFNYQIECYVPAAKRKYGYYSLPIIYGNNFVARLDPKADRKTGVFTVKSLWFEPEFNPDDAFFNIFAKQLKSFSTFCGCNKVELEFCNNKKYQKEMAKLI